MYNLIYLEGDDIVNENDWCRPMHIVYQAGGYSENSEYSGWPLNNLKWARVNETVGKCWFNRSVYDFQKILARNYEFIRGEIPEKNKWKKEKDYLVL